MATASVLFVDSFARIASMRAFSASSCGFACACRVARLVSGGCPHIFLHIVEARDPLQQFSRHGSRPVFVQIEDLAPRMSPAADFDDASRAVEMFLTWIAVGLQMTAKVFQHRFGMFSAPVGGESEPDGGFCQPARDHQWHGPTTARSSFCHCRDRAWARAYRRCGALTLTKPYP